jgi:hypothetical protein
MTTATNETSPFHLYKHWVVEAAGITVELADKFADRMQAAYEMGEPVWMIADEIKLRAAAPRKTKTPRQMAASVVTVAAW